MAKRAKTKNRTTAAHPAFACMPNGRTTISLSMMVRNAEATLPRCLASVRGVVDETVVIDTGSSDGTRAVAERYSAKVGYFDWCDDFAAARNYALGQARGEWVLHLNAGEALDPITASHLRGLVTAAPRAIWAFEIPVVSVIEQDGAVAETVSYRKRLFRRNPGVVAYRRAVNEEITHRDRRAAGGVARTDRVRVLRELDRDPEATRQRIMTRDLPILLRAHQQNPEEHSYLLQLSMFAGLHGDADLAAHYWALGFGLMTREERAASELLAATTSDLMRLLLECNRHEEAWNAGRTLAGYMDSPELNLQRGQTALGMGKVEVARGYFVAAAAKDTRQTMQLIPGASSWLPLWGMTTCALLSGDSAEGLRAAGEARSSIPDPRGLALRAALFMLRIGHLGAALECLRGLGLTDTATADRVVALDAIAGGMAERDDRHGLTAALGDLCDEDDTAVRRRQRAGAFVALGRHRQAAADLERALELDPSDLDAALALGDAYRGSGEPQAAIAAFDRAARIDSTCARAWHDLGRLQFDEGFVADAELSARRLIQLEPADSDAHRLLAECLRDRGDIPAACELLIDVVAATPEDKDSRLMLASLLESANAREEAVAVLAQALDYDDQDAAVYLRLGELLAAQGRADDAFNAFQLANALAPATGVLDQAFVALQRLTRDTAPGAPVKVATAAPGTTSPAMGLRFGRAASNN